MLSPEWMMAQAQAEDLTVCVKTFISVEGSGDILES